MSWGPFQEKGDPGVSMTRVVAFLFAVVFCTTLLLSARTTATSMGWPFSTLGIVVVLAVPLQALFKSLQTWLATPPGKKLIGTLIEKVATAPLSFSPGGGATSVTTTVESNPAVASSAPDPAVLTREGAQLAADVLEARQREIAAGGAEAVG